MPFILENGASVWYSGRGSGIANLAIKNMRRENNTPRALTGTIKLATKPILSLDWDKPLVRAIGSKTIDELLRDIRIAGITSGKYGQLARKLKNINPRR